MRFPVYGYCIPVCVGALVLLYLCMVAVVVLHALSSYAFHEAFKFPDAVPEVTTSGSSLEKTPTSTTALPRANKKKGNPATDTKKGHRPRLVRSLQTTASDSKDASSSPQELDEASFREPANWMRADTQYVLQDLLPLHKRLMKTNTQFGDDTYTVSNKDQCKKIPSTDALMGTDSLAMYQCAETALLRIYPTMNIEFAALSNKEA